MAFPILSSMPGRPALPILLALLAPLAPATSGAVAPDPLDRVQLHRNPGRGVPYLPLGQAGAAPGEPVLAMTVARAIELDGDPLLNTYSGLRPIDADGDGDFEFAQWNGFRFLQVWDDGGTKLWRVEDPVGRIHNLKAGTHRDTVAILDLDGDGGQDIAHCWLVGGRRTLVYRRGLDGKLIRSVPLEGGPREECQMAAFRVEPSGEIQILVAHNLPASAKASCPRNWVGNWVRAVAFDRQQRRLWEHRGCDAGHHAWPVDEDQDGFAEAFFVGKHLVGLDGKRRCTLATWPQADHVDSLAVADLDPARPGLEAVAVGLTGTAMFEAATCRQVWRLPTTLLRNPQHLALARLDPTSPAPLIVADEKGVILDWKTAVITPQGQLVARNENDVMPMQNADLDGARGLDEMVGSWGRVIDRFGNLRLDRGWYWDLKGTKVQETATGFYPEDYDRWQAFPLVVDLDRDGKDEIVQWGQSLIVVGKVRGEPEPPNPDPEPPLPSEPDPEPELPPTPDPPVPPPEPPLPAPATDRLFWLRYVASYPDLIATLGPDPEKAVAHYTTVGRGEGRSPVFDPAAYVARNPWLRAAFAADPAGATAHYITTGYGKGFTFSDTPLRWLRYVASHPDLIRRFGALASGGELDWLTQGRAAGRVTTFDPAAYLRQDPAAKAACRTNLLCATRRFIAAAAAPP